MENNLENTNENQNTEPKVDTSALEARIKALEAENRKLKQATTNASADASEWKKKYQSKLSDEEKAKQEQENATAAMQKELEELRTERNIAKYTSALVAHDIGMDADTARQVAEALNAGKTDEVFDGIRKFIVSHDKALKENAFRANPTLTGGGSTKAITKEQFDRMGYTERVKVFNEHPDLYKEYTS